jgi:CheY-like chemotaxis protein
MTSASAPPGRRGHPRVEVMATAVVLTARRYAGHYLVENLSAGGALLIGEPGLEPGERVEVLLQLPGREPMALSAEILRRQVNGCGQHLSAVAFRDLAPGAEDAIQETILEALERSNAPGDVLVIDDSAEVCHALQRDLRALGRRALSATSPPEAVSLLEERPHRVDTALVDLRLGDADGLEVLGVLSAARPGLRRVLMSGEIRPCQLELALLSRKVDAVLGKPWSREVLARVVAR